jgi:predicted GH43/DUF377 family glycosyl hydrolase
VKAFKWKKEGLIFNPADHKTPEWMNEFAQAPAVMVYDGFIRVYFSCRPKPDAKGQYVSYSGWVELDRKDLHKVLRVSEQPILNLGDLGTFDEFGTYPVSVIRQKEEYHAYFGGWTRCESVPFNVAIGMAKSKDGKVFERLGNGPVLSYSMDEPFVLSGPKIRRFNNKFYLFYIAGKKWVLDNGKPEPVYKIRLAVSDDGLTWKKINKDLIPDKVEANEAQASPDVIWLDGKYHMFFCYRFSTGYRGKQNGYRIGYAYSEDLINWTRDDSKVGIDVSAEGWDSEMISYPHVFELDGKLNMFYLGNGVGRQGFGLAVNET